MKYRDQSQGFISFHFEATGTLWQISLWLGDQSQKGECASIEKDIKNLVENFEQTYSRFRTASLLSQLRTRTGKVEVPKHFTRLLEYYKVFVHFLN